MQTALIALIVLGAIPHLLLGGIGLVRLAVQFPAVGRRLDPIAFAHWARASDLGNGLFLYPLLGIGGPVATWAALAVAEIGRAPGSVMFPLIIAAVLAVLHVLTTTQAAPTMMRIGRAEDRAEVLTPLIERFAFWSWLRFILQVLDGAALVWALIAIRAGAPPLAPALLAIVLAAIACQSILAGATLDQLIIPWCGGGERGSCISGRPTSHPGGEPACGDWRRGFGRTAARSPGRQHPVARAILLPRVRLPARDASRAVVQQGARPWAPRPIAERPG